LFFSIIFHEFAHGYMAFRRGDDTAYHSGRLTLNPLPHIDFMGTIALPVLCHFAGLPMFGWAKPVPINPLRLYTPRTDVVKVAACGPLSNLLLAAACAVFMKLALLARASLGPEMTVTMVKAMGFGITINIVLAVFNLIPLAPLDGSRIVAGLLPYNMAARYESHARYAPFILIALIFTGAIKYLILPPLVLALFVLAKMGLPML